MKWYRNLYAAIFIVVLLGSLVVLILFFVKVCATFTVSTLVNLNAFVFTMLARIC